MHAFHRMAPGAVYLVFAWIQDVNNVVLHDCLWIWHAACTQGSVWPEVLMHDRHLLRSGPRARVVVNRLAHSAERLEGGRGVPVCLGKGGQFTLFYAFSVPPFVEDTPQLGCLN
jgi:hypothetical protein